MARRSGGFTLVELMIVVIIMAIVSAIVVPMVSSTEDARCAGAVRMLAADLETAQATALARQAQVALVFSADLKNYKVVLAAGQTLSNYGSLVAIDHPAKPGFQFEVTPATEMQSSMVVVQSAFGANRYVIFDAFGSPATGGTVVVKARNATLTVVVEPVTGAVSVF